MRIAAIILLLIFLAGCGAQTVDEQVQAPAQEQQSVENIEPIQSPAEVPLVEHDLQSADDTFVALDEAIDALE